MPPAGFEPAISATKRMQTYALDRAVTGIGFRGTYCFHIGAEVTVLKVCGWKKYYRVSYLNVFAYLSCA
jgi:hypothetical protein